MRRAKQLKIRATENEMHAYRAAAEEHGQTVSDWIREQLRLGLIRAGVELIERGEDARRVDPA